jgi:hypothetical protein
MRNKKRGFPHGILTSQPAILVKPWKKMAINRKVLRSLGSPRYIQFWWAAAENTLFIGGSDEKQPTTYEISDYCYRTKGNTNIRSRTFLKAIIRAANLDKDTAYAILGEYMPELGMVAFKTGDAIRMEADAYA